MSQKELDRITDIVLSHNPDRKSGPLKVIAGAPDKPLMIGDVEIPCYVLEDQTRVLSQGGFLQAIGRSRTPKAGTGGVDKPPAFLSPRNLEPFISGDLEASTIPIPFMLSDTGPTTYGYKAETLPKVCEVYLKARDAGAILPSQAHIATQCDLIIRGLAEVGIIALVDEATGYQNIRAKRALAQVLEKFLAEELKPWARAFPLEYYEEICRLKKWSNELATNRPSVVGRYTNDLVYDRLAPGVLEELRKRNPVIPETGRRRDKHHQWLSEDYGTPKLREHILVLLGVMKVHNTWESFMKNVDKALPKRNDLGGINQK